MDTLDEADFFWTFYTPMSIRYDANFAHFAHSAVLNHHKTEHSPVFLRDGKLVRAPRRGRRPKDALHVHSS